MIADRDTRRTAGATLVALYTRLLARMRTRKRPTASMGRMGVARRVGIRGVRGDLADFFADVALGRAGLRAARSFPAANGFAVDRRHIDSARYIHAVFAIGKGLPRHGSTDDVFGKLSKMTDVGTMSASITLQSDSCLLTMVVASPCDRTEVPPPQLLSRMADKFGYRG